jgi:uncharacterized protein
MSDFARNIRPLIERDLQKKFVFLSGPRQVGKTTLAKAVMAAKKGSYFLYDDDEDRRLILEKQYLSRAWVCLDEFHKFPRWKNHLKGVFDKYHEKLHLLLTGSGRLDVFQKSGDSLFGRYYLHHLHPLTLGEMALPAFPPLLKDIQTPHDPISGINELLRFGGFPEPFNSQSETEHRRWSNARRQLLVREDLREMSHVELLGLVEQLMILLPDRIGSLFSFNSLAEDIRVSPITIKNWMAIFERLFFLFQIKPFTPNITRSLHKQPKYFFYDWSQVKDEGRRFENLVAGHLWKAVQVWTDLGWADLALHFIRDRDRREVDFLVTRDGKPWFLVEVKLSEVRPADTLDYFCNRLQVPGLQLVLTENVCRQTGQILVVSANRWLGHLP